MVRVCEGFPPLFAQHYDTMAAAEPLARTPSNGSSSSDSSSRRSGKGSARNADGSSKKGHHVPPFTVIDLLQARPFHNRHRVGDGGGGGTETAGGSGGGGAGVEKPVVASRQGKVARQPSSRMQPKATLLSADVHVIDSPRSLEACYMIGVDPHSDWLQPKPLAFFVKTSHPDFVERRAARWEARRVRILREAIVVRQQLVASAMPTSSAPAVVSTVVDGGDALRRAEDDPRPHTVSRSPHRSSLSPKQATRGSPPPPASVRDRVATVTARRDAMQHIVQSETAVKIEELERRIDHAAELRQEHRFRAALAQGALLQDRSERVTHRRQLLDAMHAIDARGHRQQTSSDLVASHKDPAVLATDCTTQQRDSNESARHRAVAQRREALLEMEDARRRHAVLIQTEKDAVAATLRIQRRRAVNLVGLSTPRATAATNADDASGATTAADRPTPSSGDRGFPQHTNANRPGYNSPQRRRQHVMKDFEADTLRQQQEIREKALAEAERRRFAVLAARKKRIEQKDVSAAIRQRAHMRDLMTYQETVADADVERQAREVEAARDRALWAREIAQEEKREQREDREVDAQRRRLAQQYLLWTRSGAGHP